MFAWRSMALRWEVFESRRVQHWKAKETLIDDVCIECVCFIDVLIEKFEAIWSRVESSLWVIHGTVFEVVLLGGYAGVEGDLFVGGMVHAGSDMYTRLVILVIDLRMRAELVCWSECSICETWSFSHGYIRPASAETEKAGYSMT